jgi:hypothetical protein
MLPSIQRGLCSVPLEADVMHMYNVNISSTRNGFQEQREIGVPYQTRPPTEVALPCLSRHRQPMLGQ